MKDESKEMDKEGEPKRTRNGREMMEIGREKGYRERRLLRVRKRDLAKLGVESEIGDKDGESTRKWRRGELGSEANAERREDEIERDGESGRKRDGKA